MAGNTCLSRFNIFRRNKQPKHKFPNGEKTNHHDDPVVLPDNAVRKPPTKTELTQAPQTESQTQHAQCMPIAGHEQTMTPSTSDTTHEDSASKKLTALIEPKLLWDRAYDSLREDQHGLVEAYEKVLSCELAKPTASSVPTNQQNVIEQKDTETRRSQMRQLVDQGLAKTERGARSKQGAGPVVDVALAANNTISTALKECPEAALAWTGVTFALQVSAVAEPEYNGLDADMLIDDSQPD